MDNLFSLQDPISLLPLLGLMLVLGIIFIAFKKVVKIVFKIALFGIGLIITFGIVAAFISYVPGGF